MYEGSESMENIPSYQKGDIVWVKLSSYWWPGEVKNEADLPADLLADFKKPPLAIVKFFEEDSYEYVKQWSNIYPYNCDKKTEFIKKGMGAFRAKLSHMAKFPKDIGTAEELTNGNPNILSQPEFLPPKKINYDEIFGTPPPKKNAKGKTSNSSVKKTVSKDISDPLITHRRFLGNDDYKAFVFIQDDAKMEEAEIEADGAPPKLLTCELCNYQTKRVSMYALHAQDHEHGTVAPVKRKQKKVEDDAPRVIKSPKPRQYTKKPAVQDKPVDVFENLLNEWSDDEVETRQASKEESEIEVEEATEQIVEAKNHKSVLSKKSNKDTQDDIKNCFDFDEDEEEEDLVIPTSVGRKIPRVIPEKPKASIEELMELSDKEGEKDEYEVEIELPRVETHSEASQDSEVVTEQDILDISKDEDESLENTFKELMDATALPSLTDLAQTLKAEQNFHDARTVKFPDKGGTPKKKFITSFADFEAGFRKASDADNEIRTPKSYLKRDKAKTAKKDQEQNISSAESKETLQCDSVEETHSGQSSSLDKRKKDVQKRGRSSRGQEIKDDTETHRSEISETDDSQSSQEAEENNTDIKAKVDEEKTKEPRKSGRLSKSHSLDSVDEEPLSNRRRKISLNKEPPVEEPAKHEETPVTEEESYKQVAEEQHRTRSTRRDKLSEAPTVALSDPSKSSRRSKSRTLPPSEQKFDELVNLESTTKSDHRKVAAKTSDKAIDDGKMAEPESRRSSSRRGKVHDTTSSITESVPNEQQKSEEIDANKSHKASEEIAVIESELDESTSEPLPAKEESIKDQPLDNQHRRSSRRGKMKEELLSTIESTGLANTEAEAEESNDTVEQSTEEALTDKSKTKSSRRSKSAEELSVVATVAETKSEESEPRRSSRRSKIKETSSEPVESEVSDKTTSAEQPVDVSSAEVVKSEHSKAKSNRRGKPAEETDAHVSEENQEDALSVAEKTEVDSAQQEPRRSSRRSKIKVFSIKESISELSDKTSSEEQVDDNTEHTTEEHKIKKTETDTLFKKKSTRRSRMAEEVHVTNAEALVVPPQELCVEAKTEEPMAEAEAGKLSKTRSSSRSKIAGDIPVEEMSTESKIAVIAESEKVDLTVDEQRKSSRHRMKHVPVTEESAKSVHTDKLLETLEGTLQEPKIIESEQETVQKDLGKTEDSTGKSDKHEHRKSSRRSKIETRTKKSAEREMKSTQEVVEEAVLQKTEDDAHHSKSYRKDKPHVEELKTTSVMPETENTHKIRSIGRSRTSESSVEDQLMKLVESPKHEPHKTRSSRSAVVEDSHKKRSSRKSRVSDRSSVEERKSEMVEAEKEKTEEHTRHSGRRRRMLDETTASNIDSLMAAIHDEPLETVPSRSFIGADAHAEEHKLQVEAEHSLLKELTAIDKSKTEVLKHVEPQTITADVHEPSNVEHEEPPHSSRRGKTDLPLTNVDTRREDPRKTKSSRRTSNEEHSTRRGSRSFSEVESSSQSQDDLHGTKSTRRGKDESHFTRSSRRGKSIDDSSLTDLLKEPEKVHQSVDKDLKTEEKSESVTRSSRRGKSIEDSSLTDLFKEPELHQSIDKVLKTGEKSDSVEASNKKGRTHRARVSRWSKVEEPVQSFEPNLSRTDELVENIPKKEETKSEPISSQSLVASHDHPLESAQGEEEAKVNEAEAQSTRDSETRVDDITDTIRREGIDEVKPSDEQHSVSKIEQDKEPEPESSEVVKELIESVFDIPTPESEEYTTSKTVTDVVKPAEELVVPKKRGREHFGSNLPTEDHEPKRKDRRRKTSHRIDDNMPSEPVSSAPPLDAIPLPQQQQSEHVEIDNKISKSSDKSEKQTDFPAISLLDIPLPDECMLLVSPTKSDSGGSMTGVVSDVSYSRRNLHGKTKKARSRWDVPSAGDSEKVEVEPTEKVEETTSTPSVAPEALNLVLPQFSLEDIPLPNEPLPIAEDTASLPMEQKEFEVESTQSILPQENVASPTEVTLVQMEQNQVVSTEESVSPQLPQEDAKFQPLSMKVCAKNALTKEIAQTEEASIEPTEIPLPQLVTSVSLQIEDKVVDIEPTEIPLPQCVSTVPLQTEEKVVDIEPIEIPLPQCVSTVPFQTEDKVVDIEPTEIPLPQCVSTVLLQTEDKVVDIEPTEIPLPQCVSTVPLQTEDKVVDIEPTDIPLPQAEIRDESSECPLPLEHASVQLLKTEEKESSAECLVMQTGEKEVQSVEVKQEVMIEPTTSKNVITSTSGEIFDHASTVTEIIEAVKSPELIEHPNNEPLENDIQNGSAPEVKDLESTNDKGMVPPKKNKWSRRGSFDETKTEDTLDKPEALQQDSSQNSSSNDELILPLKKSKRFNDTCFTKDSFAPFPSAVSSLPNNIEDLISQIDNEHMKTEFTLKKTHSDEVIKDDCAGIPPKKKKLDLMLDDKKSDIAQTPKKKMQKLFENSQLEKSEKCDLPLMSPLAKKKSFLFNPGEFETAPEPEKRTKRKSSSHDDSPAKKEKLSPKIKIRDYKPESIHDLQIPAAPTEAEMVPLSVMPTLLSEKDLVDTQVEITTDTIISEKAPATMSSSTITIPELLKKHVIPAAVLTKPLLSDLKSDLLDLLEGNSNSSSASSGSEQKFKTSFDNYDKSNTVQGIIDFEDAIPSQIVLSKKVSDSVIMDSPKLLERLSMVNQAKIPEKMVQQPPKQSKKIILKSHKPGVKPIVLTEKVMKPLPKPEKRQYEDVEDIEKAFIIHKNLKKEVEEPPPPAPSPDKPARSRGSKSATSKVKILQQSIISPKGEVVPQDAKKAQPTQDDSVFDINSMPIVMSEDLLTPESIQNMPVVMSGDLSKTTVSAVKTDPVVTVKTDKPNVTVKADKPVVKKTIPSSRQIVLKSSLLAGAKPGTKVRIQTNIKPNSTIIGTATTATPKQTMAAKYVLLPNSGVASQVKQIKPIIRKQPLKTPATTKSLTDINQGGNKIMIFTNSNGQQTRLLVTPEEQKALMAQAATKSIMKNVLPKALLQSAAAAVSGTATSSVIQKTVPGPSTTVSGQPGLLMTADKSKSLQPVKKPPPSTASPMKTVLIKHYQGKSPLRKVQGNESADLDRQVAEQLKAIKATARLQQNEKPPAMISYTNRQISGVTRPPPRRPTKKDKPKVVTTAAQSPEPTMLQTASPTVKVPPPKQLTPPRKEEIPSTSGLSRVPEKQSPKPATILPKEGEGSRPESPPKQDPHLVMLQDGVGNVTSVTVGQIIAIPSETLDGQPQSYMLVTVDVSGNLIPLNNEDLMSLDPSLGAAADMSNIMLQMDQGEQGQAVIAMAKTTKVKEELKTEKKVKPEEPKPVQPVVEQQVVIGEGIIPGDTGGQQLILQGDPSATQKFIESLSDGSTDLASILANAEGGSVLIQADGQHILIRTNAGVPGMGIAESTEGAGNPLLATHKPNQDILAAALADTDVLQPAESPGLPTKPLPPSQLSPGNPATMYPMQSGMLESFTITTPIVSPLEVPSTNTKKIDDQDEVLGQVPRNHLPITITDPNITQTVAQQQAAGLLDLALPSSETNSSDINTSYYSLPPLDDSVAILQKPFNCSMPLLGEEVEVGNSTQSVGKSSPSTFESNFGSLAMFPESIESSREEVVKTTTFGDIGSMPILNDDVIEDSGSSMGSTRQQRSSPKSSDHGLSRLGGDFCSSLSEPPPDMFDLTIPQKSRESDAMSVESDQSAEIPIQMPIVADFRELKRMADDSDDSDGKRTRFD